MTTNSLYISNDKLFIYGIPIIIITIILYLIYIIAHTIFNRSPDIFDHNKKCMLLKPCHGVLDHINNIHPDYINYHHIYWFLNIFDIHIQYVPICGTVVSIENVDGKFHPAYDLDSSHQNERVITKIRDPDGNIVVIEQVAGLLTRKIDNYINVGDKVLAGQKLGKIHFGSRVVLRIPNNYDITKIKEKVHDKLYPGSILIE